MPDIRVRTHRLTRSRWVPMLATAALTMALATPSAAQQLPAVSIGAGLRTSFVHTAPEGGDSTDTFNLDDIRLYVNGAATKNIKFMFNTDYAGSTNALNVLDAVARLEFSPKFNIWMGRFLPPSDRANLYGPFYASHWAVYTDGVQDGYPFIFQGRDNGVAYWGQFGKVKLSGGVFDGVTATGLTKLISAGRVQVDFWDAEDGYYLNGTYYGDKNLLALGVAGQVQGSDRSAYSADFLLERKVGNGGAYTIEAEYAKYDKLGGYNPNYGTDEGGYGLAAYLFPKMAGGGGQFQVLGKYAYARFQNGLGLAFGDFGQKTTEINLNYVIKQFNSRVMTFYKDTRYTVSRPGTKQFGVGMQIQM